MKKLITLMLLGFALAFGVAVTVIAPAAWAIADAVKDAAAFQAAAVRSRHRNLPRCVALAAGGELSTLSRIVVVDARGPKGRLCFPPTSVIASLD